MKIVFRILIVILRNLMSLSLFTSKPILTCHILQSRQLHDGQKISPLTCPTYLYTICSCGALSYTTPLIEGIFIAMIEVHTYKSCWAIPRTFISTQLLRTTKVQSCIKPSILYTCAPARMIYIYTFTTPDKSGQWFIVKFAYNCNIHNAL